MTFISPEILTAPINYYFENNFGGYGYSTDMPAEGEFKRMITKEEYDQQITQTQEDMWGRKLMTDQMVAAQKQAADSERESILSVLAAKTGLTLEQLKSLF